MNVLQLSGFTGTYANNNSLHPCYSKHQNCWSYWMSPKQNTKAIEICQERNSG